MTHCLNPCRTLSLKDREVFEHVSAMVQRSYLGCIPGNQETYLHHLQMKTGVHSSWENEKVLLQGSWTEVHAAHDILIQLPDSFQKAPAIKLKEPSCVRNRQPCKRSVQSRPYHFRKRNVNPCGSPEDNCTEPDVLAGSEMKSTPRSAFVRPVRKVALDEVLDRYAIKLLPTGQPDRPGNQSLPRKYAAAESYDQPSGEPNELLGGAYMSAGSPVADVSSSNCASVRLSSGVPKDEENACNLVDSGTMEKFSSVSASEELTFAKATPDNSLGRPNVGSTVDKATPDNSHGRPNVGSTHDMSGQHWADHDCKFGVRLVGEGELPETDTSSHFQTSSATHMKEPHSSESMDLERAVRETVESLLSAVAECEGNHMSNDACQNAEVPLACDDKMKKISNSSSGVLSSPFIVNNITGDTGVDGDYDLSSTPKVDCNEHILDVAQRTGCGNDWRQSLSTKCMVCKHVYKNRHDFVGHLLVSVCVNVAAGFPPGLVTEVQSTRQQVTSPQCPLCNKVFTKVISAQIHHLLKLCLQAKRRPDVKLDSIVKDKVSGLFQCTLCDFKNMKRNKVNFHYFGMHVEKSIECGSCDKKFGHEMVLQDHIRRVHGMPSICDVCGKKVLPNYLARHKKQHDNFEQSGNKPEEQIKCENCQYIAGSKAAMTLHKARVHAVKDKLCEDCGEAFALESDVRQHRQSLHSRKKQDLVVCGECGCHMSQSKLQKHMETLHKDRALFKCTWCQVVYHSLAILIVHERLQHADLIAKSKWQCHQCGLRFSKETLYTEHMNKHSGTKPYQCPHCAAAFRLKGALKNHMECHNGLKYKCDMCPAMFGTYKYLRQHRSRRHKTTTYLCICGTVLENLTLLSKHRDQCTQWKGRKESSNRTIKHTLYHDSQTYEGVSESTPDDVDIMSIENVVNEIAMPEAGVGYVVTLVDDEPKEFISVSDEPMHTVVIEELDEVQEQGAQLLESWIHTHDGLPPAVLARAAKEGYLCTACNHLFPTWEDVQQHVLDLHVEVPALELETSGNGEDLLEHRIEEITDTV